MKPTNTSTLPLPAPSTLQLLFFFLLLGWLSLAPMIVAVLTLLLPVAWPDPTNNLLSVALLAACLLTPAFGYLGVVWQRQWHQLWPLALIFLMIVLYTVAAAGIQAISDPGSSLESILRLIGLTVIAIIIGGLGLLKAGVPDWSLTHTFGFNRPLLLGLLLSLIFVAIVTAGWPLTGALGDNWATQLLLVHSLALTLPEEILFRGAIVGLLFVSFRQHKLLATLIALLAYLTFTPTGLVPHHDWGKIIQPVTLLPFALLLIELRVFTGSIWAGVLFAWLYRAAPLLFTDPRVDLPLITQPWQTVAHIWMMAAAAWLVIMLWLGRRFLQPRWSLSYPATAGLALAIVLLSWGTWTGAWFGLGYPGFHNDGFLIVMAEQADLTGAEAIADLDARRAFVRDRLIETAEHTQAPVRAALEAAGLAYRPFYLINMIQVDGHHRRMADFAGLPGVARVMLNPNVRPYSYNVSFGYGNTPEAGLGIEWNIDQVDADAVWEMGLNGQGIVVAGQDTGYDWEHPALRDAYRGNTDGQVKHAYHWHDAWSDSPIPFDDDQHGTHTMGTILGNGGNGNHIGMAPGARWIGCRNMRRGLGNPASYTACMEFFLAPYPPGGDPFQEGDVSQAPHIVNNSWGCPDIEGCDDDILAPAAAALRAAGIMMVVSAGNSGPRCQTVSEPPARYDQVFSVGATDRDGQVTGFSSRGPVPDAASLLKPDVTAPGSNIRSSLPGGSYGTADGTSMASPHVAGLAALIWSANPDLIGRIDETEAIIRHSATQVEINTACSIEAEPVDEPSLLEQLEQIEALEEDIPCACGDATGTPNNVYGWGEINALEAVKLALEYNKP